MVSLLWYYRPEQTKHGRRPEDVEHEIYASKHKDICYVHSIEAKCYVLTFNEYCRYATYFMLRFLSILHIRYFTQYIIFSSSLFLPRDSSTCHILRNLYTMSGHIFGLISVECLHLHSGVGSGQVYVFNPARCLLCSNRL
jgi:hypothetical protein